MSKSETPRIEMPSVHDHGNCELCDWIESENPRLREERDEALANATCMKMAAEMTGHAMQQERAERDKALTAVPIKVLVFTLEGASANTDTDWRWQAATALRKHPQWETAIITLANKEQKDG